MINRNNAYQLTQSATEDIRNDIFNVLEFYIEKVAKKGATHIVYDFLVSDENSSGINDWSEFIKLGDIITEELHDIGFNADYLGYSGKDKRIKIQIYWGNEPDEEYIPLDSNWWGK